jgi:hypothetical protein
VRVTLQGSNSVRLLLVFWYGFLIFFVFLAGISATQPGRVSDLATLVLFVGGFVVFPLLLSAFGRAIAYQDRSFLTGFLIEELQLQEAGPTAIPIA